MSLREREPTVSLRIVFDAERSHRRTFARRNSLHSIEEPLVLYRIHPGNRSRSAQIHLAPGEGPYMVALPLRRLRRAWYLHRHPLSIALDVG